MDALTEVWERLDPAGEPRVEWVYLPGAEPDLLLLGAFDPPTRAHVALARGAGRATGGVGGFCLTKVLLDRPGDELLPAPERLELLRALATEEGLALAVANRGTYLEIARVLHGAGRRPGFVIGSDKLPQLEDPSFYPDGERGVAETFRSARFYVVPRGVPVARPDVVVLDPDRVFPDRSVGSMSATEVRRRLEAGHPVDDLVPPVVARALGGYTEPSER